MRVIKEYNRNLIIVYSGPKNPSGIGGIHRKKFCLVGRIK